MPLGKKVEYLWMYYKIWLVILAVVIGVIYLGCTMYKGRHTTVLLNVAVTGGDSQKAEELNKDFCKYAGIDEKDGIIRIQANIPEDGGSLSSKTALTTLVGADAVDVLICREDVYQEYKKQDGFQETIDFPAFSYTSGITKVTVPLFNYYGMRNLRNKTTRSQPVHTDSWLEILK